MELAILLHAINYKLYKKQKTKKKFKESTINMNIIWILIIYHRHNSKLESTSREDQEMYDDQTVLTGV